MSAYTLVLKSEVKKLNILKKSRKDKTYRFIKYPNVHDRKIIFDRFSQSEIN